MNIKCNAYHGTDINSKETILKEKFFIESSRDNEWAGHGVYFFIDKNEKVAQQHAYDWAKQFKKIRTDNIGIILAELEYTKEEILDLCDEEDVELFNEYRRCYFEIASKAAKEKRKILSENRYTKRTNFDCFVINEMCKKLNYKIVKKSVYITKLEKEYNGCLLPLSYIPNCTIAAVRDQSIIRKIGDYDGQKTC